jgi:hypothetical protein
MRSVEVGVPAGFDFNKAIKIIEHLCVEEGLTQNIRRTLKGYPGSIHLHYKRGYEKGTLEITIKPEESSIWFSVHDNRKGAWTNDCADRLAISTRRALVLGRT